MYAAGMGSIWVRTVSPHTLRHSRVPRPGRSPASWQYGGLQSGSNTVARISIYPSQLSCVWVIFTLSQTSMHVSIPVPSRLHPARLRTPNVLVAAALPHSFFGFTFVRHSDGVFSSPWFHCKAGVGRVGREAIRNTFRSTR